MKIVTTSSGTGGTTSSSAVEELFSSSYYSYYHDGVIDNGICNYIVESADRIYTANGYGLRLDGSTGYYCTSPQAMCAGTDIMEAFCSDLTNGTTVTIKCYSDDEGNNLVSTTEKTVYSCSYSKSGSWYVSTVAYYAK